MLSPPLALWTERESIELELEPPAFSILSFLFFRSQPYPPDKICKPWLKTKRLVKSSWSGLRRQGGGIILRWPFDKVSTLDRDYQPDLAR